MYLLETSISACIKKSHLARLNCGDIRDNVLC